MNKLLLFAFSILCLCASAQVKMKIELVFKYTKPYCGGAKLSAEKLAEVQKETPLSKWKFYVYKDNQCIDSIQTNDSGKVIVKYFPGTYYLFESWKQFKKTPDNSPMKDFFKDCLVKEWAKPNYKLTISEGDFTMDYYEISASRCPNQLACLKVRHLPSQIKRK